MKRYALLFNLVLLLLAGCTATRQCSREDDSDPGNGTETPSGEKPGKKDKEDKDKDERPVEPSKDKTFWLGADISWATEMEARGESLYGFEGGDAKECSALSQRLAIPRMG